MTVAEIGCILGTLVGIGVLGTRVEESSGGALAADATLLAPASPAFSIWSVIYGGLAAYTIWQWLPANTANIRARRSGWLVALSMLLNAALLLYRSLVRAGKRDEAERARLWATALGMDVSGRLTT